MDVKVCPHCNINMELKNAPFIYKGTSLGDYEAYVCPNCGRAFFTEESYKTITKYIVKRKN
ncbi:DUF7479 domain-containing protein [Picrophilus oshimae]|uniref:DUF7479 domain-containing protein n=1 Tax=Picrophilus torridus (strain ATCC 700027 / DSM 9790 / JCM 10055 / NBRC 100828 / KAW 2/3) TaxID=1122961 RepID=Q6L0I3_PICTO|nr:hypothetical protein [Picrophilus oshimae]AAT43519.1 hypothetical protein PTO0934 [Picrophilus oshimae DSM 9789]SMD30169.1 hypothetical protein SAMN02745355_0030 [Picrophilus oshimae DSM 9789]